MTRGEAIAQNVRDYLRANGITQAKLTGATLAEIADRTLDRLEQIAKKKKRLATEEDWIKELEREPHLSGVNVRKELAALQFWCKNKGVLPTRQRFVNWLNKAERSAVVSPGGAVSPAQRAADEVPKGWLAKLNELFPESTLSKGGLFEITEETDYHWTRLDKVVQDAIRRAL